MGKSISYCYRCSTLLREDDFLKGKAFQDGNRVVCVKCAPELGSSTTKLAAKTAKVARPSTTKRVPAATPSPNAPEDFEQAAPPRSRLPLILGAAGGGVLLVIVIVVLLVSQKPPAPATPVPEEKTAEAPKEKEKPRKVVKTPDQELLESARKFVASHPEDLAGQIEVFQKVVWDFESSASATEAKKEIGLIREKIAGKVKAALDDLEKEIADPLKKEAFGAAIKIVEGAASRLAAAEWTLAVGKRSREIHDQAKALSVDLAKQIETLSGEGKKGEAEAIVRRVRTWELPSLLEKVEEALATAGSASAPDPGKPPVLAAVPVEARPRTPEGKGYLEKWEQAMVRVASRDYAAGAAELERAAAALKEADVQAEAKADLEDVKRLQAFVKETLEDAVAKPRGWMSLELRDGRKVAGRVLQIDADRVELGSKETAFAEWSEVVPASLVAVSKKKPEPRVAAIFCLAEGDVEAAKAQLGGPLEAVAPKYWAWAPGAKAKIPRAEGLEASAREIFYAAEREYRSMQTRGLATEKYKSLIKDFSGSSVVRRAGGRIERRSEACKEYYFAPADFERAGTIKMGKGGRLESDADSDANFANQNWAEAEFYVLPGATYRAWILAGGCCGETFSFLWQATELTAISPRTKKSVSADVGGAIAPEVKHSIRNLKPGHDPKTPKMPARWEWIELQLPKYAGPGPKRVRFMTDQKGFGIGALVVSSSRKLAPKDDELKELDKARAVEAPLVRLDPDLVVWYTFDEGAGSAVEDGAGGHKGSVNGKAGWVPGKLGGGLEFDGQTHVEAADAEDLRLTGDLTIAFWMNKKNSGGDWQRMVGKGTERLRTYGVWTGGDQGGNKVLFQQYNEASGAVANITTQKDVQIGKWHHFAATVQGGKATIYLDGEKQGEATRSGTPVKTNDPLILGWANIHAKYVGSLDDVRIYKRGLTPEEVRDLFDMGK